MIDLSFAEKYPIYRTGQEWYVREADKSKNVKLPRSGGVAKRASAAPERPELAGYD